MPGLAPNTNTGPYIANGTQTVFPFTFTEVDVADVGVQIDGQVIARERFSVALTGSGGAVTFGVAPAAGSEVLPFSDPDFAQLSQFENQSAYNLSTVNVINKRASIRDLYLLDGLRRSLRLPYGEIAPVLPAPRLHPDAVVGTDDDGVLGWQPRLVASPPPQRADFTAAAGQTRFPLTGPLIDTYGLPFDDRIKVVTVTLNGIEMSMPADFTYAGGAAPVVFTKAMAGGESVVVLGQPFAGAGADDDDDGFDAADSVLLHEYPGTANPLDNDNAKWANARADVTNPASENYGKRIFAAPGLGSGTIIPAEPRTVSGVAIDPRFLSQNGDWTIDSWSQNGIVPDNYPTGAIHDVNNVPSNIQSGVHLYGVRGKTRFRRPHRTVLRPYIFVLDPKSTSATTVGGVDTQSDVAVDFSIRDIVTVGLNHWLGFQEHVNDISINGGTNFVIDVQSYGCRSDVVYLGAGNIGGGAYNRHNKNGRVFIEADGYNKLNRNALSVIDCDGLEFRVIARNYSKGGGAGTLDPMNPNTGVGAPGAVDIEPNDFTDDPIVRNIRGFVSATDCDGAALATLLLNNDSKPHPIQNIEVSGEAIRCYHGKHIAIGGNNMKVGYGITVRMNAVDCYRPFEMNAGQGITHVGGNNFGSTASGYIGYSGGQYIEDFWQLNETFQELGKSDTAGIQVRGWKRGGRRGCTFIDCKTRALHYLANGTAPVEGLAIESDTFRASGKTGVPLMTHANYVDPSGGGAKVDAGSVTERNTRYNSLINYGWIVAGARVRTAPSNVRLEQGQSVFALPTIEPGGPREWYAIDSNTLPSPAKVAVAAQVPGFLPDPAYTAPSSISSVFMTAGSYGRFTANAVDARANFLTAFSSGASFDIRIRGVYSGSGTVYFGLSTTQAAMSFSALTVGIWLGDTTNGAAMALPIVGGMGAGASTAVLYSRVFRIRGTVNSSVYVEYSDNNGSSWTQLLTTGLSSATLYPSLFIGTMSETAQVFNIP